MAEKIDYRGIRASLNVERVFDWLGLDMRPYGNSGQLRGPCPMCNSRSTNTLVYTPSEESWCCQGTCQPRPGKRRAGGDIIDLVGRIRGISNPDAAQLLDREFLGNSNAMPEREHRTASRRATVPSKRTQEERQEPATRKNESAGMQPVELVHDHEMVEQLGFKPADAEALGIGFQRRGTMPGYVLLPIRLSDGTLSGYVGIDPETGIKLPKTWHGINVVPFPNKKRA